MISASVLPMETRWPTKAFSPSSRGLRTVSYRLIETSSSTTTGLPLLRASISDSGTPAEHSSRPSLYWLAMLRMNARSRSSE